MTAEVIHRPPPCNTGVATTPTMTIALDYLACHVEEEAERVVPMLAEEMGAGYRIGRPMHGYGHGAEIVSGDDVWVRLFYNRGSFPFLQASGANASPTERAIRRLGLSYRVTRKDAALDLFDAALFPRLVTAGKAFAAAGSPQLSVEFAGDWQYAQKGRTLYVGSRRSKFFHRLYEKGRKERADPNWIRLEVQYNPDGEIEQRAACEATPGEIFAMRAFAVWAPVLREIGLDPQTVFEWPEHDQPRVRRDVERARRALAAQYGKVIEAWLRDAGGDPQAFVVELLVAVEHQRNVRTWASASPVHLEELNP